MSRRDVRIEGLSPEEILELSEEELDALVSCDEPVAFRAGSAELLGEFRRTQDRITLELAHIDGGGEGVLPTIGALARRHARRATPEWSTSPAPATSAGPVSTSRRSGDSICTRFARLRDEPRTRPNEWPTLTGHGPSRPKPSAQGGGQDHA